MKRVQLMIQEVIDGKDADEVVKVAIGEETRDPEPEEEPEDPKDRAKKLLDGMTKGPA